MGAIYKLLFEQFTKTLKEKLKFFLNFQMMKRHSSGDEYFIELCSNCIVRAEVSVKLKNLLKKNIETQRVC
jgi:hypothetical protein